MGDLAVLPFGKHKGVPLGSVPTDYLRWLVGNGCRGKVREVVVGELDRRGEAYSSAPVSRPAAPPARRVIREPVRFGPAAPMSPHPKAPMAEIPCPSCGAILAVTLHPDAGRGEVPF